MKRWTTLVVWEVLGLGFYVLGSLHWADIHRDRADARAIREAFERITIWSELETGRADAMLQGFQNAWLDCNNKLSELKVSHDGWRDSWVACRIRSRP